MYRMVGAAGRRWREASGERWERSDDGSVAKHEQSARIDEAGRGGSREEAALELVVLELMRQAAHCRVLGSAETVTLRAGSLWGIVPGEIVTVRPAKRWTYGRTPYLSGTLEAVRLDVQALGLTPLRLEARGLWEPAEHYWGEEGEPVEEWARPLITRGARPAFEMEQVLPGAEADDPFADPIIEALDLREAGDWAGAEQILGRLCRADLRCLDAHSHLGNALFDRRPKEAIRHYAAGYRIGELSLPAGFDGLLPWGWVDNRPFLRCMHGYGLCLWRLQRFEEAEAIFERMLWLNPADNLGARMVIGEVRAGEAWHED